MFLIFLYLTYFSFLDISALIIFIFLTFFLVYTNYIFRMPRYNTQDRYNSDELDPCLAAEVRFKSEFIDYR